RKPESPIRGRVANHGAVIVVYPTVAIIVDRPDVAGGSIGQKRIAVAVDVSGNLRGCLEDTIGLKPVEESDRQTHFGPRNLNALGSKDLTTEEKLVCAEVGHLILQVGGICRQTQRNLTNVLVVTQFNLIAA